MDVLCTFKNKEESHGYIMGISKTSDDIQIKIKMPNPSRTLSASSKSPNRDFKDIVVLGASKIKIEGKNLEHRSTKDQ